jgi:hypothetical protein
MEVGLQTIARLTHRQPSSSREIDCGAHPHSGAHLQRELVRLAPVRSHQLLDLWSRPVGLPTLKRAKFPPERAGGLHP